MPVQPRFSVVTIGVEDVARAASFYERLGFTRKMKTVGDEVAFFETGATAFSMFRWDMAAGESGLPDQPRPPAYRGMTLAWNCNSKAEVDAALAHAVSVGAKLLKPARDMFYGGYCGHFADPDGHVWEVVTAPGISVGADGRVTLPD
jgi:predicted lactoylglutathione lyase